MNQPENQVKEEQLSLQRIIDLIVRLLALSLLIYWCFLALVPFFSVMLWASVLAISLYPSFNKIKGWLKGKNVLAAVIITILMLAILIVPAGWLILSTGGEMKTLASNLKSGEISIPPPAQKVGEIPLVGQQLHNIWSLASTNLQEVVLQYKEQIKTAGVKLVSMMVSAGVGLLLLAAAIIISGVLLVYATSLGRFSRTLFVQLAGDKGYELVSMAESTVRNVTRGILGVAFIQSLLAGIGMLVAGVPLAGLWTVLCLLLAIVQISMLPVSIGVIIYAWSNFSTTTSILLTIWMLLVGISDNILKPIMLGKGASVPMLVVFLGAIGGFIHSGFIGLFTGAIMLSLGYKLFMEWTYSSKEVKA